ncbi:MAG: tetratricopeptide repeat protein [Acidobacteria bacterium]|nr:tetratricopeptide repeat protein [Acidobacteriota bacterium]
MENDGELDDDARVVVTLSAAMRVSHLLAVGQITRAKEAAADAIAAEPNNPLSYHALARVLLAQADVPGAIAALEQSIALAPDWAAGWSLYATALFRAGRFAAAEKAVLEALRNEPDEAGYFTQYGRILAYCSKKEKALELARRALELDPDDEGAHQLFAALLHEVSPSKWQLSEEVARRAVGLNPDDPDGYAILGAILLTQRRYDEAESMFRTALEQDPHHALAIEGLAQLVMRQHLIYRPFLGYALVMRRLGTPTQMLVVLSLWVMVSLLRATILSAEPGATILVAAYLAFALYTWFAEPVMRAILRRKYHWL